MAAVAVPVVTGPARGMTSAAGVLSLLEEEDRRLQAHALRQVALVVDLYWTEVLDAVVTIEELSEDTDFEEHELAALIASKVFFHEEEYEDALRLALAAGTKFNVDNQCEYVDTIISKCIDTYIAQRCDASAPAIDARLEDVVNRMFQRCFTDGAWDQAVGIAVESKRLDMVEAAITQSPSPSQLLAYCFDVGLKLVSSLKFRDELLGLLVQLYRQQAEPEYFNLVRALQFLDDSAGVADVLMSLVDADDGDKLLTAYQAAFDIVENQNQQFQLKVAAALPSQAPAVPDKTKADAGEGDAADAEGDKPAASAEPAAAADDDKPESYWEKVDRVRNIVLGNVSVDLYVDFLAKNNHADVQILKDIKAALPPRSSVLHHATVVSHGFMLCGTTCDRFLLENLDWLKKANNWARFSVTAQQGVVHKGHVTESMKVLEPYLPKDNSASQQPYLEGGALYALGLIHANQGNKEVLDYLSQALHDTQHHVLQHGACLGIGLAAMATAEDSIYGQLRKIMFNENANAGEAAGMALGLLLAGAGTAWESQVTGENAADEMLTYARETKHEKTSRGIGVGIALLCYGQQEAAADLIDKMCRDKDAVVRYGGMFALGMSFAGTSNNGAIRRLLHVAVSDVSDDVRRAAVTNLGFVMLNNPEQVPTLVALLAESYNAHVRYGACMAIGISCAGTAAAAAVAILQPMCEDKSDFVRQGAFMALAMVLQQQNDTSTACKEMRERLAKAVQDKHSGTLTRLGAIVSAGILDAGGRNCVIALKSRAGFNKMSAIVGMALWLQHWYWHPCMHMMSLALAPTAVIGLNKDLKVPRSFSMVCDAKQSAYAYPPFLEPKKEEKKTRVAAVELSTTAKAKAKARRKEAEEKKASGSEDVEMKDEGEKEKETAKDADGDVEMKKEDGDATAGAGAGAGAGSGESSAAAAKPDPRPFDIKNPSRVTHSQAAHVSFDAAQRYVPIRKGLHLGAVMLKDTTPDEAEDVADFKPPPAQTEMTEPEPPEPFEWTPN